MNANKSANREGKNHFFDSDEIVNVRRCLLKWYDENKRDLPWRKACEIADIDVRAYRIWVSEVMLQQTQVSTVIEYYNRWMVKWPTVGHLSKAHLEEVNRLWSGLGYYSRAKRLHEGAVKVVDTMEGRMPRTAADLRKELLGVGRYTANAIASIAYGEVVGVVDGNVIRVLTRLRTVGSNIKQKETNDWLWFTSDLLVDRQRPADFNQAIMELGATVCTPKSPSCSECPVRKHCWAYRCHSRDTNAEIGDIEHAHEQCSLCLPKESCSSSLTIEDFPLKVKKKDSRVESVAVAIFYRENRSEFLMIQRPNEGLLANLWEFPNMDVSKDGLSDRSKGTALMRELKSRFKMTRLGSPTFHGEVLHVFSHIKRTYFVFALKLTDPIRTLIGPHKWMSETELKNSAISTAMKKVFDKFSCSATQKSSGKRKSTKDNGRPVVTKRHKKD